MFKNPLIFLALLMLLACKAGQDGSNGLPEPEEGDNTAFEKSPNPATSVKIPHGDHQVDQKR